MSRVGNLLSASGAPAEPGASTPVGVATGHHGSLRQEIVQFVEAVAGGARLMLFLLLLLWLLLCGVRIAAVCLSS